MEENIIVWPHAPSHYLSQQGSYIITCGTYRKQHLLNSPEKLSIVRNMLFQLAREYKWELQAWAIMSNHYHFVAASPENPSSLKKLLSTLHTLSAKELNRIDGMTERKVWYNYYDSHITYEKSWYARLNYVHQNPVHHGVIDNAKNYEWCSAAWFAKETNSSLLNTVNSFKIDRVNVYDDFGRNQISECGSSTPFLNKSAEPPYSKSDVEPSHSKELAKLYRLTGKAVTDYKMIQDGDRLLVGISGGVDSMMLMHVLTRLQKRAPIKFELFGVNINEGFEGLNHAPLKAYAAAHDWNLKIIDTPIAQLITEKEAQDRPCALCSRLRRGFIHGYADEIGAKKLVLGHHRDDLCVSLLMGLFRGTGLKTMGPNVRGDGGTKRVIRPLCYAPKDLIETCAKAFEFPTLGKCDYSDQLDHSGDRANLERLLKTLEADYPNLGKSMLHSMQDVRTAYLLDKNYLDLK